MLLPRPRPKLKAKVFFSFFIEEIATSFEIATITSLVYGFFLKKGQKESVCCLNLVSSSPQIKVFLSLAGYLSLVLRGYEN